MGALEREAETEVFRNETEAAVWAGFARHNSPARADELLVAYRKRRVKIDAKGEKK